MKIIAMNASRWEDVKRIYQQGIDTGQANFEEFPPNSGEVWAAKFLSSLQLICLDEDTLLGWAAISRVSSRRVYKGGGEVSLYIDPDHQGRGIGKVLLKETVSLSEKKRLLDLAGGHLSRKYQQPGIAPIHWLPDCGYEEKGWQDDLWTDGW
jgi:L-amino acid N-acyltransferase YncA